VPDEWKLELRDENLDRIAEIEDYRRFDCRLRFNRPGVWSLEVDYDSDLAPDFAFKRGVIVSFGDEVLLSGPIEHMQRQWSSAGNSLIVTGVDDSMWFEKRLAYPEVTGNFAAQAYDVRTGVAETVMHAYANFNAGPGAVVARRVAGLVMGTNLGAGASVTGRARFQVLGDLLREMALAGGDLGFRVIQEATSLEFQVFTPEDKSDTVIFSGELGNLQAFDYSQQTAEANFIIGAGGGEGTARVFVERSDATSISSYGRMETFRDRRDTTDTTEITQTLDEELSQQAEKLGLAVTPTDTQAFSFPADYSLGDRVTVVVDGVPVQDVVREVHVDLTPVGAVITPTVGTPGAQDPRTNDPIFQRVAETRSRLRNLERR
jgi:hypothetical protein